MRHSKFGTFLKQFFRAPPRTAPKNAQGAPSHLKTAAPTQTPPQFRQPIPSPARGLDGLLLWGGCLCAGLAAFAVIYALSRVAGLDFTLIVAAMIGLCAVVAADVITRRKWERKLTQQMETLAHNHDRLVREVARNRNELALFKETLAQAGHAAINESRRLPPTGTAEARMMQTIATQLEGLADLPRPSAQGHAAEGVMELSLAPPKALPPPLDSDAISDPERIGDDRVRALLRQAIREDHVEIFMQPVVSLPQRKARMMEVYARIRAGDAGFISARRYADIARHDHLLGTIDNLLLLRCLQMLRDTRAQENALPCALNIAAATLQDAGFMNDLVAFLAQHRKLAARLIFELPQNEMQLLDDELAPVLSGLAQLGCRFSVDRVQTRRINVHRLRARHVRFLKLDAQWLINEGHSTGGITRIAALKKQLDSAGIDLIVEKIETEDALRELLDFNIDFGQGYLFGAPEQAGADALTAPRRAA